MGEEAGFVEERLGLRASGGSPKAAPIRSDLERDAEDERDFRQAEASRGRHGSTTPAVSTKCDRSRSVDDPTTRAPVTDRLISADGHVVEPLEVFAPVAERFARTRPKLVHTEDRGWVLDTGLGWTFQPGRFATAGMDPRTAEYEAQERSGYARDSLTDLRARLRDMDQDGIEAEVLFPTMVGSFLSGRKLGPEASMAVCRSYNDWLLDYCSESRGRLIPLACIPVGDVDVAVGEVERAKRLGHVGVVVSCGSPKERPYADPSYDRLWAAAQAARLPVAFHAGFGSAGVLKAAPFERHGLRYSLRHVSAALTMSDLVYGGVCERFPDIRFVFAEFGTGWSAHFFANAERRQHRTGGFDRARARFSEYWHRNFRITFEDDAIGVRTRREIGVETLMWASDYPHGDSVFPNSRRTVDRIMTDCSPAERHAMTAKNVAALYRLPLVRDEGVTA